MERFNSSRALEVSNGLILANCRYSFLLPPAGGVDLNYWRGGMSIGPDARTVKWSRQMKFIAFGLGTAASKRAAAIAIRLNIPVACPVGGVLRNLPTNSEAVASQRSHWHDYRACNGRQLAAASRGRRIETAQTTQPSALVHGAKKRGRKMSVRKPARQKTGW
jgi:hypothetical protein